MNNNPSRRRWWTQEEDQILLEEVKTQLELGGQQGAKNWNAIAEKLPGRSNKDCRKRWTKISLSSRKGTWSGAEDHLLRKAVGKFNFQWTKVAEMVGSRHPDQCAKRWHHSLDPNVKRSPWTPDEDHALINAVHKIGRDWKEIGRGLFPSRSTTDIKNRYVILRRRQDKRPSPKNRVNCEPSLADIQCLHSMNMFNPDIDLSVATTPCNSDIFTLTSDTLNMPPPVNLPPYLFDIESTLTLSDIPEPSLSLDDSSPSTWDPPDWAAFDEQQLAPLNILPSDTSVTSDMEICDPSLRTSSNQTAKPNVSESAGNTASTLVLENLHPETVNLVIDTLLKTKSKFGMRLYNGSSI
ncbi:hypothetical protein BDV12DRAFT_198711 [Aspergillus spectabilis]